MILKKLTFIVLCFALSLISIASVQAPLTIFIVPAYQETTRPFLSVNGSAILEASSTVSGRVDISGGQSNDIIFWVTDSNNVTVAGYGDINRNNEFSFVVPTTGNYTAHFDNSISQDPKSVTFDYAITPPILGIPQALFYTILATMLIAIAIIIAAVLIIRRRKRATQIKANRLSQKSL